MSEWGRFDDPDTVTGMQRYADAGLELHTPDHIRGMDADRQLELARACGGLLVRIYDGKYPLSVDDADELVTSVRANQTHLFALTDPEAENGESLVAMAAVVDKPNTLGGDVRLSELGRAAANPDSTVSARALLKNRVPWAVKHTDADMLYSVTRSAGDGDLDGLPSGRGVQSVWWGSRAREGSNIPFVTTTCGYDYRLGKLEPFNGFTIPTDAEAWLFAAAEQPVYLPNEQAASALRTILEEGTNGRLWPNLVVPPTSDFDYNVQYREVYAGEAVVADKFIVTGTETALVKRDQAEVDTELTDSISQKVTIEADVAGTAEGATVMQTLEQQGWTLCGWTPSELVYGGICPVYTRINPAMLGQVVSPGLHEANFDKGGLSGTRKVLKAMYKHMVEQAAVLAVHEEKSRVTV